MLQNIFLYANLNKDIKGNAVNKQCNFN